MTTKSVKVEIWSDVVCPWCYIGKRRFEEALEGFEHRNEVEVIWRSFQLDPGAPHSSDTTVTEHLATKYGVSKLKAEEMNSRVTGVAAEVGLEYHLEDAKYSNTFDSHRLIHLGAEHGLQGEVKERLMRAYFTEGKAIGDPDTLVQLVSEVGIDKDEARAVLESDTYAHDVERDLERGRAFGISGVPFFAINERYGVSGAQPADDIREALGQAWTDSHPLIQVGAKAGANNSCEGDNCTL